MTDGTAVDRLATYGTLSPGRENHHQMNGMRGRWSRGSVRGHLVEQGWGATLGYPALVLDPDGPTVAVYVFESADLPAHLPRLDDFEGDAYRRVRTRVALDDGGAVDAWIYISAEPLPA